MRANYGPIMLINGIIASTSPGRYPHIEIDWFLLKLRQINVISLTAQHGVLIENYEIYNCEWNKHFFVSGAASLFFLLLWRSFLWTGRLKWSASAFWLFSTELLDSASPRSVVRNLKSAVGLLGIRGSAQIWKPSFLTEKQGQQRSGPVLTSLSIHSLSLGSAWEKWALAFIQRDL